ncbi:MAG TPA: hypothetical protein VFF31_05160 [Blastocatellia bacterium]|nr:hypothetical protein [Blastocatellia bacterium]
MIACYQPQELVQKNRVPQGIKDAVVTLVVEQPACGQVPVANMSCASAGWWCRLPCVWLRHDLETICGNPESPRSRTGRSVSSVLTCIAGLDWDRFT